MTATLERAATYASFLLRLALGTAFLSAVADRFGVWGPPGATGVAWGSFEDFLGYAATLNPYVPEPLLPALGWLVTISETTLGVALIVGFRIRETAALSGVLLIAFAFGMTSALGVKTPLDYSVFTASAGSFLLAVHSKSPWSIDELTKRGPRK